MARDLYYQLKQTELFPGGAPDITSTSVRMLQLLGKHIGCSNLSRSSLRITSAPKGCVIGPLSLTTRSGARVEASHEPWTIPGDLSEISQLRASTQRARFFLVVEKLTVFAKLVELKFHRDYATILCTGRGFPDMGTRAFVRLVADQLGLVPFCLTDWNPSGLHIHLSFKEGNTKHARACGDQVRVPRMQWVGLHHADVLSLSPSSFDPLSVRDGSILKSLLKRPALTSCDHLMHRECLAMLAAGVKADLDHIGGLMSPTETAGGLDLVRLVLQKMLRAGDAV